VIKGNDGQTFTSLSEVSAGDHDRRWLFGHGRHAGAFDSKIFSRSGRCQPPSHSGRITTIASACAQSSGELALLGYLQEKN